MEDMIMTVGLGFVSFFTSYVKGLVELRGFDKIKIECPKDRLFPLTETSALSTVPIELGFIQHRMLTEEAVRTYASDFQHEGKYEEALKYLYSHSPLEAFRDDPDTVLEGNRIDAVFLDERLMSKYKDFLRYLASDFVKVYYTSDEDYDGTTRDLVGQMSEYQQRGEDTFYEGVWWRAIPKNLPGIDDNYLSLSPQRSMD